MKDDPLILSLLDDFYAESDEHLNGIRRNLLALEALVDQPTTDRALLDELFRHFHSLKGLSGMVGLSEAEQLAHHMESYLRALRNGQTNLTNVGLDALVDGVKALEQVLTASRAKMPLPDVTATLAQLDAILPRREPLIQMAPPVPVPTPPPVAPPPAPTTLNAEERARLAQAQNTGARAWRFEFTPSPALAERGINVNAIRARLQEIGELIRAVPRISAQGGVSFEFIVATRAEASTFAAWTNDGITFAPYEVTPSEPPPAKPEPVAPPQPQPAPPSKPEPVASPSLGVAPANIVRVDLARLDELMRMVGELVISRARLEDHLQRLEASISPAQWRSLQEINLAIERQLRDLREGVMRVRLVPIGEVFERMHFVVRDLARETKKQVRLEIRGRETEIDKLVVEQMMDPLLHLVRNAVSHGIESPDERAAAGKPPEGTITLGALTAGDLVVIEIEDDGRGIDPARVAARARELGLLGADEKFDEAMLLDVLCAPGFSTRTEADRASGRGVGMSVVRETVRSLGGTLALESQVGRGSRFIIQLPITLAIMDAFIVRVGEQRFAMPQPSVREVIEVPPASIKVLENNEIIYYRGGVLPLVHLGHLFGLEEKVARAYYALVIGSGSSAVGILVDRILGQREIVVRALSDPLVQVPGVSGATELGDGRVVLILDANALARMKRKRET